MTALSLIQTLIPTTPSAQSGASSISGQGSSNGQGAGLNPFAQLVPGAQSETSLSGLQTVATTETTGPTVKDKNNPSADLLSLLAGSQITNKKSVEGLTVETSTPEIAPALEGELVVEDLESPIDGTEAAVVPAAATQPSVAPGDVSVAPNANGGSPQASASIPGVTPVAPQSATPIDAEAALKAAAPQTQAGGTPAQQAAATGPALQIQGDVLEGGQGAPTAQKLLGIADPKAVTETAQRDPAAATLVWGANQKNGPNGANGNTQSQNPFLSASQQTGNAQPAFHEGQAQTGLPDPQSQKLPSTPVTAAQPRFDVAAHQTAGLDASVAQTDTPDGLVVGDQRPPVTVTVRFDQTIHGPQLAAQHLAMHIKRNFANGVNRFEVRLDPPELGRIDVRLDLNTDGRVAAALTVDRPETLDLLQRDARLLQKALQEAGINLEDSNLNFSLRDENGQAASEKGGNGNGRELGDSALIDTDDGGVIDGPQHVAIIEDDRVDIRI